MNCKPSLSLHRISGHHHKKSSGPLKWHQPTGVALLWLLAFAAVCCTCDEPNSSHTGGEQSTGLTKYREPSSLLLRIISRFMDGIDWKSIIKAQEQVEIFVRSVDRVLSAFRSSGEADGDQSSEPLSRLFTSSFWSSSGKATGVGAADGVDTTNVKAMLERIACFVGYMRLLNHSNEALAELDASKVVSNLFNASKKNSSFFSNWFG